MEFIHSLISTEKWLALNEPQQLQIEPGITADLVPTV
jgi:hypothetical protein